MKRTKIIKIRINRIHSPRKADKSDSMMLYRFMASIVVKFKGPEEFRRHKNVGVEPERHKNILENEKKISDLFI